MLECLQNNDDEYQKISKLVLKRLTGTLWNARADATKALSQCYNCFQKALQAILKDTNQTQETICEAKCLLKGLSKKENIIMEILWSEILDCINVDSKSLQKETIELHTTINLFKSLLEFNSSGPRARAPAATFSQQACVQFRLIYLVFRMIPEHLYLIDERSVIHDIDEPGS